MNNTVRAHHAHTESIRVRLGKRRNVVGHRTVSEGPVASMGSLDERVHFVPFG